MANKIYQNGRAVINLPAQQKLAIYLANGSCDIYQSVDSANSPESFGSPTQQFAGEVIYGPFQTVVTFQIETMEEPVYWEMGTSPRVNAQFVNQVGPASYGAPPPNLLTSDLLGSIVLATNTSGANQNYPLPSAATLEAALSWSNDQSIEWTLINLSTGANTVTITVGTNHTVTGNMVVAVSSSATFVTRRAASGAFSTYRK